MDDEDALLNAIKVNQDEDVLRLAYADLLDERNDPRADFIRLHLALKGAGPDHVDRLHAEEELSLLRKGCDATWVAIVEPERQLGGDLGKLRGCMCFESGLQNKRWATPYFHHDAQDTECDAWKRLLDLIEKAADDGREQFAPARELGLNDWSQILTLPSSIGKLKSVRNLTLYGSYLVRIPPEIGEMSSLEIITPYTSYRLHWFPYELTRCRNLRSSTVSTRALYGNYKHRPPFPRLDQDANTAPGRGEPKVLPLKRRPVTSLRRCSVCDGEYEDRRLHRVWVSLRVATDVLPLLVNACSEDCVAKLPSPPENYIPRPHKGGLRVTQPPPEW